MGAQTEIGLWTGAFALSFGCATTRGAALFALLFAIMESAVAACVAVDISAKAKAAAISIASRRIGNMAISSLYVSLYVSVRVRRSPTISGNEQIDLDSDDATWTGAHFACRI
jgi:hypothetical protein